MDYNLFDTVKPIWALEKCAIGIKKVLKKSIVIA